MFFLSLFPARFRACYQVFGKGGGRESPSRTVFGYCVGGMRRRLGDGRIDVVTSTSPSADIFPRRPVWQRWPRLPEAVIGFVMAAIVLTGVFVYARDVPRGQWAGAYLSLAVGALACALAVWGVARRVAVLRWVGLGLAAITPAAAAWAGIDQVLAWNQALFVTCLLVLAGLPVWWGLLPAGAAYFAQAVYGPTGWLGSDAIIAGTSVFAGAIIGVALRAQRRYWAEVALRARDLAAGRDTAVARGVAEERLRIARDLHDLIGHEIAAINLRLGAAEIHLASAPGLVRDDLAGARGNVQTVLAETQRLLALLRTPADPSGDVIGYAQIPDLLGQSRAAGLSVEATLPDIAPPVTAETGRAAYRIVQEILTNAAKHGTGSVSLKITCADAWLTITAANVVAVDGANGLPPHQGYGLIGMRERAASVGGDFSTETDGHLFWARARLPLEQAGGTNGPGKEEL